MTELPIIFKGKMVRAILGGHKTQTRRPCGRSEIHCEQGDHLWVRETFWMPPPITSEMLRRGADTWPKYEYDATIDRIDAESLRNWGWNKKPSIHMPREASRITLKVVAVRIEHLQNIMPSEICKEGIIRRDLQDWLLKLEFQNVWNSCYLKTYPWKSNPLVQIIEFRRMETI